MPVYLDYNASAPIHPEVLETMVAAYSNTIGNADSRMHVFGTNAQKLVQDSRRKIAEVLGIEDTDLILTSGATESNNMAVLGIESYARETGKTHIVTTAMEHKAILEPLHHLEKQGFTVDYICPHEDGRVSAEEVLSHVTEKTALVSVMFVNSETGIVQPIAEIGAELKKKGVLFHVDGTQALGKINSQIRTAPYDMMSFAAHKIGGPQGIGALVLKRGADYKRPPIAPLMYGGPQERGYRPGTTPVALVAGFAKAAEICEKNAAANHANCERVKKSFLRAIQGLSYQINGDPTYCIPSTINISFAGLDAEAAFLCLGDGYSFSNGSACNSAGHALSYVLEAMGLDQNRRSEAIRLSWDGSKEIDFSGFVNVIKSVV